MKSQSIFSAGESRKSDLFSLFPFFSPFREFRHFRFDLEFHSQVSFRFGMARKGNNKAYFLCLFPHRYRRYYCHTYANGRDGRSSPHIADIGRRKKTILQLSLCVVTRKYISGVVGFFPYQGQAILNPACEKVTGGNEREQTATICAKTYLFAFHSLARPPREIVWPCEKHAFSFLTRKETM